MISIRGLLPIQHSVLLTQHFPPFCLHAQGISIDSYQILDEPERKWVELVQRGRGLALFTWGSRNNSRESVDRQREMGVNGIIYDRWAWLCVLKWSGCGHSTLGIN